MRQPNRSVYQFTILISISQVVSIRIFCLITVCDLLRLQGSILSILHDSDADTLAVAGREALSTTTSRSELRIWCYVLGFSIDVVVCCQKVAAFVISVCQQGAGRLEIIERWLIVSATKVELVFLLAQRKEIFTIFTFLIICFLAQQGRPLPWLELFWMYHLYYLSCSASLVIHQIEILVPVWIPNLQLVLVQRAQRGFRLLVSVAFLRIRIGFVVAKNRTKYIHILCSKFLLGELPIASGHHQLMIMIVVLILMCGIIKSILKQLLIHIGRRHLAVATL